MYIKKLISSVDELIQSIELSIENRLRLPALIMIYSGIDLASWLGAENDDMSVEESFMSWVQKYILPIKRSNCSAIDLYVARCRILHTLTPRSELIDPGEAKRISYGWRLGNGSYADEDIKLPLKEMGQRAGIVILMAYDLFKAYRIGWNKFIKAQRSKKSQSPLFEERALKVYVPVSKRGDLLDGA